MGMNGMENRPPCKPCKPNKGFSLLLAGGFILLYVIGLLKKQYILIAIAIYLILSGLYQLGIFSRFFKK